MTFFWTFLLVQMINYVVSSMIGAAFNLQTGTILAVCATILIFIVAVIIPDDSNNKQTVH
ncbi:uncharacterized membrane protein YhaH (DUF805 family) [Cytobacillus eiseniae]|uniref:Uncharacterized membrane protein YhaH (DUF805 family) n=1 Tax=Cytobacillus eiseniae TaxID=762947 RepID=A0ABS4RFK4_9BACI|nr:YjzD family protein [Cytobacillus eiseniae]MBP2241155.1 uncharacterized membrane protein YhaH (DUF805 family) [Cytobacillus eiseniae]